jgi:hypothetical protein
MEPHLVRDVRDSGQRPEPQRAGKPNASHYSDEVRASLLGAPLCFEEHMPDNRRDPVEILDPDFLKDRYDFELTRKESLTSALALPVGILSGLGSVLAYMAQGFTYRDPVLTWLFAIMLAFAGAAFLSCLFLLGRAYLAQTYVYLPLLRELADSRSQFIEYAKVMAGGEAEVLEEFEKDFERRIIDAADRNTQSNDLRSKFLHWGRISLFVLLGLTFATGFPYVIDQVRFVMPTQQAPKPTRPQPASTPQKPSFPENRVIKEGREPGSYVKK